MDKRKQAEKSKLEDQALSRTLMWFGGAVVVEFLLLLLDRYYVNYGSKEISIAVGISNNLPLMVLGMAVLSIGFGFWMVQAYRKGQPSTVAGLLTGISFGVFVSLTMAWQFYASGIQVMCAVVPAVAVLALVYHLYQREFFASTLVVSLGILGLWVFRQADGSKALWVNLLCGGAIVVALAMAGLLYTIQQKKGLCPIQRKNCHIFEQNTNYLPMYTSCILVPVALIIAMIAGTSAAYYLLFALVAWLFILAVYYTVRQM